MFRTLISPLASWMAPVRSDWERDAAGILVRIQWFGLMVGFLLANVPGRAPDSPVLLNLLLSVGLVYACVDTWYFFRGDVFLLSRYPLLVAFLETIFITLLCRYDVGLNSPYRFYYLLSLLVVALRYPVVVPYLSCALHCLSYTLLFFVVPSDQQDIPSVMLNIVVMGWVTWAASTMAWHLHRASRRLVDANTQLQAQQNLLEVRIEERTTELQEAQALLIHQEKMAAFGLLAAGIAHEVGNPLTSISSLVQLAQRKVSDPYVQERLGLVGGQLDRISGTLRELVNFSRPATAEKTLTSLASVAREALSIAKYYKTNQGKTVLNEVPDDLPHLLLSRDQLTQALLNLILNAIDATEKGGTVRITGGQADNQLFLEVHDNGCGISTEAQAKLFQPYYTTKPHGTGLGLFMTRRLVEQQGGTVSVHSVPQQGTTFRIQFSSAAHHV
ncbi:MAG TPA: ATP-binding protein [Gemmatales bacterium]|nr:ATP-binding protein [Gemmatales bacterium]